VCAVRLFWICESASIWLDALGGRLPTLASWTCGREVAPMRFPAEPTAPRFGPATECQTPLSVAAWKPGPNFHPVR
jgi:hypothetical protein